MGEDMSFFGHLEELRRRLVISIVSIGVGFAAGWVFLAERILRSIEVDILGGMKLTALTPLAAALARMKISLVIGLVVASPIVAYEFLAFVIPALKPKEKRLVYKLVLPAVALFLVGLSFGYLVMVPLTMNFLMGMFKEDLIVNMWGVDQTISFIFLMLIAFGAIFEYPLVAGMVSSLGFVGPDFFRRNRPLAVIGILVVAAVITPDPTMVSQIVVAVPMYILYEVGILLSSLVYPGDDGSGG
jgi:sec-independent protein translocase protein TatC